MRCPNLGQTSKGVEPLHPTVRLHPLAGRGVQRQQPLAAACRPHHRVCAACQAYVMQHACVWPTLNPATSSVCRRQVVGFHGPTGGITSPLGAACLSQRPTEPSTELQHALDPHKAYANPARGTTSLGGIPPKWPTLTIRLVQSNLIHCMHPDHVCCCCPPALLPEGCPSRRLGCGVLPAGCAAAARVLLLVASWPVTASQRSHTL